MRSLLIVILIIIGNIIRAQAPFTSLVKEPRIYKKAQNALYFSPVETESEIISFFGDQKLLIASTQYKANNDSSAISFFKNSGLTYSLIDEGESRVSVSAEVLHYKIFIANPSENNKHIYTYNIPLFVIAKLSTNYDSLSPSGAIDALDYEAAPITIRIMPSWKWEVTNSTDVIYAGLYADIRALNLPDTEETGYQMKYVRSGGCGFTYQGKGAAGYYSPSSDDYVNGKWSFSFIYEIAEGKHNVISSLFNTDKNVVSSIQGYFIFNVADNSKSPFNIKIGYQQFFKETIAGTKSNFSVSLGI